MDKTLEKILEDYKKQSKMETKEQYLQLVNAFNMSEVFETDAEKNFLILLPKLIASNRKEECVKLIGLIRRSICLHDWGTNKKSYKTYSRKFIDYLEKFIDSDSKVNGKLKNQIANSCTTPKLTGQEEQWLKEALAKREIFLHDRLLKKFKARLRCQDRTSGDKVWLPLRYISQLFNKKKSKGFTKWLEALVADIYVHYMDANGNIKSINFGSNQIFLDFETNKEGSFDVYIIWSRTQERHRAYTPTGEGNTKVPLTVRNISEIDIDHVKPIDQTLRDLKDAGNLKELTKVSNKYKQLMDQSDDTVNSLEQSLDDLLKIVDLEKLAKELHLIRKDGVLRLMDSAYNEKKSNSSTYIDIIKSKGEYLGLLGNAILDDDGKTVYLYKKLSEQNAPTRASHKELKGRKVKITKSIIDII